MKILTFHHQAPFADILAELKAKLKLATRAAKQPWRCFDDVSCMCVRDELFEMYQDHFLRHNPIVEENVVVRVHSQEEVPWGVKYVGAERLWKRSKGAGVKIAVIDTGIDRNHFELRNRVKGGIELVRGKRNGHGTHVAGIIVAEMNKRGIVGVSPEADLYDVRTFREDGTARLADIMRALNWSIKNNMEIINMSFGMPQYSEALARIVKKAADRGIVMVASAGNNGGQVEYPARYREVIGVGAVAQNGKLAEFSSRGKGMTTTAPGVDILSTWPGNSFKKLNGTSMAAPHVTGLIALRLARKKSAAS
ncbi:MULTISPECIES: S8 family peptidase [Bacillales]|uniref:Serine protease n=1 Tax=Brevibacillus aydinogluensis TaxID=927786 RepID=A0AA48MB82_9BACL|nr:MULTISPECIES: S8 family peptidase [Bacillales]MBR8659131.1 S8 family peptidase [Brevibacillus sp. NL20B1]NNV02826.1 serine protease [Brevibacillus sp. MCWH]REK62427.1 MAG: serine protease [Brevibacillus sp.]MDT3418006.1 subtilisin [Brevibacillus aydinogluensis]UFJ60266.1 S8 family peptidase [Anoxybacillus sediminis]